MPDVVVHTYNPYTEGPEGGGLPLICGQPNLHNLEHA